MTTYYLKDQNTIADIISETLCEAIEKVASFFSGSKCADWSPRFETNENSYVCYETEEVKTESEWFNYYQSEIDHAEYADFCDWWHDMMRMDLLTKAN